MSRQFHNYSNRYNRNRSLLTNEFKPETKEEYLIHEIAKALGDDEVRYLKSILDRYGYGVIQSAWEELRQAMGERRKIMSKPRFFNYLVQERIKKLKGGERHD